MLSFSTPEPTFHCVSGLRIEGTEKPDMRRREELWGREWDVVRCYLQLQACAYRDCAHLKTQQMLFQHISGLFHDRKTKCVLDAVHALILLAFVSEILQFKSQKYYRGLPQPKTAFSVIQVRRAWELYESYVQISFARSNEDESLRDLTRIAQQALINSHWRFEHTC